MGISQVLISLCFSLLEGKPCLRDRFLELRVFSL